jgi:hypothetical protein
LDFGLWFGVLFVDGFEAAFNIKQDRAGVVTFTAAQANLTWNIAHNEITPIAPIDVFHFAVFKIAITANVTTCFAHTNLPLESVGKSLFAERKHGGLDLAACQRVENGGLAAVGESDDQGHLGDSDLHGAEYSTARGKRKTVDAW